MRRVAGPRGVPDILFGEAPYGWRLSRDRSKLVKNGDEQRVLAVARHMYFVERIPLRSIVARLEEMQIVSRRGRPFGLSSVFEMVHRKPNARPPEADGKRRPAARASR